MAAAVTGEAADYQIHQVRLIAFVLITIGTIAINFNWQLERVFTVIAWVQTYFIFSGIIRQWRTLPDDRLVVIGFISLNLLVLLGLMLILIFEERRLKRAEHIQNVFTYVSETDARNTLPHVRQSATRRASLPIAFLFVVVPISVI